jgi:hypothetical protein
MGEKKMTKTEVKEYIETHFEGKFREILLNLDEKAIGNIENMPLKIKRSDFLMHYVCWMATPYDKEFWRLSYDLYVSAELAHIYTSAWE